jgi:hypothetical protein
MVLQRGRHMQQEGVTSGAIVQWNGIAPVE